MRRGVSILMLFALLCWSEDATSVVHKTGDPLSCHPDEISWLDDERVGNFGVLDFMTTATVVASSFECLELCARNRHCYAALRTSSNNCYLALTNEPYSCMPVLVANYSSPIRENCTAKKLCQLSYKMCERDTSHPGPRPCSLMGRLKVYCDTKDAEKALNACNEYRHWPGRLPTALELEQFLVAKTATTVQSLEDQIFYDNGAQVVVRCPPLQNSDKWRMQFEGGPREYYERRGPKNSWRECWQECAVQEDCALSLFIIVNSSCYSLRTTSPAFCQHLTSGPFGPVVGSCSKAKHCVVDIKVCERPSCTLESISRTYCKTGVKEEALKQCSNSAREV